MAYDKLTNSRSNAAPSVVGKRRTRFDIGGTARLTCNTGDFVPFFCKEVLPGDTFDIRTSTLTRLETSLHQTLDNAYLELAYFYVPNRIVMTDWDKLLGANDDPWARTTTVSTPQIVLKGYSGNPTVAGNVAPQSLLNHLMLPAGDYLTHSAYNSLTAEQQAGAQVTQIPLRDCFQIFNDWFRDESLDSIIAYSKGNSNIDLSNGFTYNSANFLPGYATLKVNRFRDRFSSALPAPQKGAAVTFNLFGGMAPVVGGSTLHSVATGISGHATGYTLGTTATGADWGSLNDRVTVVGNSDGGYDSAGQSAALVGMKTSGDISSFNNIDLSNLYADLTQAAAVTVNDLRLAIAAQVLSEQEARGGTRLTEVLFSQWNIKAPSLMVDRSEYLGGRRIPLQMLEVLQTSSTSSTSILGEDAGHGKTFDDSSGSALKSFMLHGYVIGVLFIRTARSYSQGIDRQFFRSDKFSYFNPIFDNIGEVPVYAKELFVPTFDTGGSYLGRHWNSVFGYQEAWYEYKEGMNRDSGYMQTGISGTMDTWHYGDKYTSLPLLASSWLKEDVNRVNRTIAVTSGGSLSTAYQWSIMLNVEAYATRQMAKYSIPNTFGFGSK